MASAGDPVRRDRLKHCLDRFSEAGVDITEIERWRKPRLRIQAGVREDLALAVLSLMAYIDRDHCLVERVDGPGMTWGETTYVVWYPTRWIHRFLSDEGRRFWPLFLSSAAILVVGVGAFAAGTARVEGGIGFLQVVGSVAFLVGVLAALWGWLRDKPGLGLDALWLRLTLGVVVGGLWALAVALPSATQVLGAVWVFTTTNILWIASIGYERWRLEETFDDLGGRLSWRQAHEVLDRTAEALGRYPQ